MVELNELFKKEETRYLKELHKVIGGTSGVGDAGYVVYNAIGAVLDDRRRNPPKPKGFKVTMGCGEEHFIETTQPEIATVEINGEQVYPTTESTKPKFSREFFADLLEQMTGDKWKFQSNTSYVKGNLYEATMHEGFGKINTPMRKHEDTVILPWYNDYSGYSVYTRVKK